MLGEKEKLERKRPMLRSEIGEASVGLKRAPLSSQLRPFASPFAIAFQSVDRSQTPQDKESAKAKSKTQRSGGPEKNRFPPIKNWTNSNAGVLPFPASFQFAATRARISRPSTQIRAKRPRSTHRGSWTCESGSLACWRERRGYSELRHPCRKNLGRHPSLHGPPRPAGASSTRRTAGKSLAPRGPWKRGPAKTGEPFLEEEKNLKL